MRWRTHRALTRRALRRLGLGGDVVEACLEEVVEPDKRVEYSLTVTRRGRVRLARKPHHSFWRVSEQIFIIPFRDGGRRQVFRGEGREGGR
jgi:hypothetical protein